MKKMVGDNRFMIKACDLYYNQNYTQREIAQLLRISRPTVSRLLASAVAKKIVRITVRDLESVRYWNEEQQLKKLYRLKDAFIVPTGKNDEETKRFLGEGAREYLDGCIKDGDKIGVSMGSTLYFTAYNDVESSARSVTFIPLIGGMGKLGAELHSNHLAEKFAKAYQGEFSLLYAPARIANSSLKRYLQKEQSVASVLQMHRELTVALVGIGYPNDNSSIKATGYYKDNEIRSLRERGVAGEICMQFYDIDGNTEAYKNDNSVIGIDLHKLKGLSYSIGVAGGEDKIPAIRGAICGGFVNVLITDERCAKELLKTGKE